MKIIAIETGEIAIPLAKEFKTALRTVTAVDDVAVRVVTDEGLVGYGEAPATAVITGDTKGSVQAAIHGFIAPALVGRPLEDFDGLMAALHGSMVHNASAKAAVDMALYDLFAQSCGLPLYKLLGGRRSEVMSDITVSVNPMEEMVMDALDLVAEGCEVLKIKVGKGGMGDVATMAAIREAVGSDIALRVDANQGWGAKESVRIIRAMEDMGLDIELVEQPVKANDFAGMQMITRSVSTPILADESVFSAADAERIIRERAADLINIKLMKTGGIYEALKICALAETHGVECMIGCMLESRLAVSAAAHLAGGKGIITRADLDGPYFTRADPFTGGPQYEAGGRIVLSETPGIGIANVPGFAG